MNFQREMEWLGVRVLRDDYRQWRKCHRKVRYSNHGAAVHAMSRTPCTTGTLEVYECEHCFGFHVGHARPAVKAAVQ